MEPKGSKAKVRTFLLNNVGRVIEGEEIREASGSVSEWARRVRELRDEEGYDIQTHRDRADLRPGQYYVVSAQRRPASARNISKEVRARVLERDGYTCQMCGVAAGDPDPLNPSRGVRLTMGHIVDKEKGGEDTESNLRAVCTACNEGLQNMALPKPDRIWLLSQIRRATVDDQKAVLLWLQNKFSPRQ